MAKLKGLRDDGSIDTKALQSNEDIYKMVDYLAEHLSNSEGCILDRDGDKVTFICEDLERPVVISVSKLKGSDRANFLNSAGIIRRYNELRKNKTNNNGHLDVGSKIDIGRIHGYGFRPGTMGTIEGYKVFQDDETIYAEISTPRGCVLVPYQLINGYSPK
ncbi:MAG: hypothetical protein N3D75_01980 [Candidatus Aenigmarchaeota archaeon]|nr:hypothetical protein [Candidatus Aenigmarchaeota archaeon]